MCICAPHVPVPSVRTPAHGPGSSESRAMHPQEENVGPFVEECFVYTSTGVRFSIGWVNRSCPSALGQPYCNAVSLTRLFVKGRQSRPPRARIFSCPNFALRQTGRVSVTLVVHADSLASCHCSYWESTPEVNYNYAQGLSSKSPTQIPAAKRRTKSSHQTAIRKPKNTREAIARFIQRT